MEMYLPWISLVVGLLARILIPWLAKRRSDPANANWQWKYVWPQVLSFVMILIILPLIVADLEMIGEMPYQAAWILGWGAGDIGRKTYKALASESDE